MIGKGSSGSDIISSADIKITDGTAITGTGTVIVTPFDPSTTSGSAGGIGTITGHTTLPTHPFDSSLFNPFETEVKLNQANQKLSETIRVAMGALYQAILDIESMATLEDKAKSASQAIYRLKKAMADITEIERGSLSSHTPIPIDQSEAKDFLKELDKL